jgi:hypothetical protein
MVNPSHSKATAMCPQDPSDIELPDPADVVRRRFPVVPRGFDRDSVLDFVAELALALHLARVREIELQEAMVRLERAMDSVVEHQRRVTQREAHVEALAQRVQQHADEPAGEFAATVDEDHGQRAA